MMSPLDTDVATLAAAIATVERALQEADAPHPAAVLRELAAQAVLQYWDRPVHAFIPVLALRDLRYRLGAAYASSEDAPSRQPGSVTTIRPLSVVLAAHRFVCARLSTPHAGNPFTAAAAHAAVVWCGATEDRRPARRAFVAVAIVLMAEGGLPLANRAPYAALVMTMLSVPTGQGLE